jgi:16S rRNA G966 N2-methylase RsmD
LSDERNQLFFGDNLRVLRDSITDASVDLIYLDPRFSRLISEETCRSIVA